jgi:hypothetical protein
LLLFEATGDFIIASMIYLEIIERKYNRFSNNINLSSDYELINNELFLVLIRFISNKSINCYKSYENINICSIIIGKIILSSSQLKIHIKYIENIFIKIINYLNIFQNNPINDDDNEDGNDIYNLTYQQYLFIIKSLKMLLLNDNEIDNIYSNNYLLSLEERKAINNICYDGLFLLELVQFNL